MIELVATFGDSCPASLLQLDAESVLGTGVASEVDKRPDQSDGAGVLAGEEKGLWATEGGVGRLKKADRNGGREGQMTRTTKERERLGNLSHVDAEKGAHSNLSLKLGVAETESAASGTEI